MSAKNIMAELSRMDNAQATEGGESFDVQRLDHNWPGGYAERFELQRCRGPVRDWNYTSLLDAVSPFWFKNKTA